MCEHKHALLDPTDLVEKRPPRLDRIRLRAQGRVLEFLEHFDPDKKRPEDAAPGSDG